MTDNKVKDARWLVNKPYTFYRAMGPTSKVGRTFQVIGPCATTVNATYAPAESLFIGNVLQSAQQRQ